jgi:hypothetical protein
MPISNPACQGFRPGGEDREEYVPFEAGLGRGTACDRQRARSHNRQKRQTVKDEKVTTPPAASTCVFNAVFNGASGPYSTSPIPMGFQQCGNRLYAHAGFVEVPLQPPERTIPRPNRMPPSR